MSRAEPGGGGSLTTEEKLALVRSSWGAFNRRDWDGFFALTLPGYVVRPDPQWPGGGEYTGRENHVRFLEQFLDPWEDLRREPAGDDPVPVGAAILDHSKWVGKGRATGLEGEVAFYTLFSFDNGLIARADFFLRRDDALEWARKLAYGLEG